jgi:pimeloyl-ACP methyl ester carboxylesterase
MSGPDLDGVLVEGPWTHREISANGMRFHVAELGEGPLVVLLHGFPQFWWSMRHQLQALAEAGYRAVAPDLRGYGGSDKPPRGYDAVTLASDVAGVIRALGSREAVVVGHDWGGFAAWATAALHPTEVRAVAALAAPHPVRFRNALVTEPRGQLQASSSSSRTTASRSPACCTVGRARVGRTPRRSAAIEHRSSCPTWRTPRSNTSAGCSGRSCVPTESGSPG